ncbi:hypothetical protein [Saliphagus infecundisoli]|uniref:Uncharacterized protein n=1 Tax=Saliphagus infecundisoli TaxID=1849069 RepID=A0ABD5QD32_9EURY|nr:hypothetical protein [Saliphagus infecundisoli]
MSQDDPDPNTDRNASRSDPAPGDSVRSEEDFAYDSWPIADQGETTTGSGHYLGTFGAAGGTGAGGTGVLVYDEERETVFEADVDEEERRLIPREDTERDVDDSGGLGGVIEDLGDSLGLDSLSEFAEERLQDDDREGGAREISTGAGETVVDPETATFTQSNVSAEADHDLEFSGAYTYRKAAGDAEGDRDDQVFDVERDFVVSFDVRDPPEEAAVEVEERVLRARTPEEDRRGGDAEPIQTGRTSFTIEFDAASDRHAESVVEERCREWHDEHPEPIDDGTTAGVGAGTDASTDTGRGTDTGTDVGTDADVDPDSRRQ